MLGLQESSIAALAQHVRKGWIALLAHHLAVLTQPLAQPALQQAQQQQQQQQPGGAAALPAQLPAIAVTPAQPASVPGELVSRPDN